MGVHAASHLQSAPPEPRGGAAPAAARGQRRLRAVISRLGASRVRFRVGQVVVGDDPFNGRREGRVTVVRPPYVGVRVPGTPAGTLVFFDHRTVRLPD